MTFLNIFSSYLKINELKLNTQKIKKNILNFKNKDKGSIVSNYGGWQSKPLYKKEKYLLDFFKELDVFIEEIQKQLSLKNKIKLLSYWFNVNPPGSFNKPHDHLGAANEILISGAYYVNTPKNCGKLIFMDKNLDNIYSNIYSYNQYNSSSWQIKPKENICVLFPSYLIHYVEPNFSKENRISISFNYGFQKK